MDITIRNNEKPTAIIQFEDKLEMMTFMDFLKKNGETILEVVDRRGDENDI